MSEPKIITLKAVTKLDPEQLVLKTFQTAAVPEQLTLNVL